MWCIGSRKINTKQSPKTNEKQKKKCEKWPQCACAGVFQKSHSCFPHTEIFNAETPSVDMHPKTIHPQNTSYNYFYFMQHQQLHFANSFDSQNFETGFHDSSSCLKQQKPIHIYFNYISTFILLNAVTTVVKFSCSCS